MYMYTTVSINCKRETATVLINAGKQKNNKQIILPYQVKNILNCSVPARLLKHPLWNIFQAICSWFSCFVVLVSSQTGAISLQWHESQHAGWFITGAIILQQHDRLRSGWFKTGAISLRQHDRLCSGWFITGVISLRQHDRLHAGWFNTGAITLQQYDKLCSHRLVQHWHHHFTADLLLLLA